MEITKDTFVILEYTLRLADGSYIKGEEAPASLNFIVGYQQVMPSLEKQLIGVEEGSELDFVIPAAEAFGVYDNSQVHVRQLNGFPEGADLVPGRWVVATNRRTYAQYSYFVKEKTEESVTLDFNHPLAGKDLYYHVKVVRVRQALPEELEYLRPCEHKEDEEGPSVSIQ